MTHAIKILYAEDSTEDAELTLRTLRRAGLEYEHRLSADLDEIGRLMEGGGFDVLLSDYNLRKFDARLLLSKRNKAAPDTPFIIVTGTLPDESAVELIKQGATDYVLKDRLSRLPAAIKMALKEREEKRRLEAARWELQESESRFRELFESASDLIFTVSLAGALEITNPAFQRLLGAGQAALAGRRFEELAAPEARPALAEALAAAAGGAEAQLSETVLLAADGRRLQLEGSLHLRRKDGEPLYLQGIFRDVTEQRVLEAQFRQAQKMEAVGRLAGGIAHDFNNILGVIEGYATLLLRGLPEDHAERPDAEEIRKAVQRAAALTRQLLIFSRKQPMQKKAVSVNSVIENLQRMLLRIIGENVRLDLKLQPDLPPFLADQSQMEQLLVNLAVNARDAMPGGGDIIISTSLETVPDGDANCPHPETAGREFIKISVADTGTGLSQQALEHMFEPFFTTKEKGKGTGLGLATVYGITRQHNGWIEAANRQGSGAEFRVFIPATAASCAQAEQAARSEPRAIRRQARLLIAEDDKNLRELAEKALSAYGHEIVAASSAAEAIKLFRSAGGAFDLFFSDMFLGDNKATELTDEMLAINPAVKFIITSGYFDEASDWEELERRGYAYLQKPYSIDALIKMINDLLPPAKA